jgi:hypothetical protein
MGSWVILHLKKPAPESLVITVGLYHHPESDGGGSLGPHLRLSQYRQENSVPLWVHHYSVTPGPSPTPLQAFAQASLCLELSPLSLESHLQLLLTLQGPLSATSPA